MTMIKIDAFNVLLMNFVSECFKGICLKNTF